MERRQRVLRRYERRLIKLRLTAYRVMLDDDGLSTHDGLMHDGLSYTHGLSSPDALGYWRRLNTRRWLQGQ